MPYQIPRGLFDVLPFGSNTVADSYIWQYIENIARKVSSDYLFKEIRTPIFEREEVFVRSSGESSDIVKKEMYIFQDKANRYMALRPEGTAPILRSFVENKLYSYTIPYKFYYIGPMFRYDRPQKGRYRQHHQFGIEYIGDLSHYEEAEVIDCLLEFYKRVGLKDITLNINSVGDKESRESYKSALKEFLKPHLDNLSQDSKSRYIKNPLRILDSKDQKDREIIKNAPSILEFLNESSKIHFENVCSLLDDLNIEYLINKNLVRGLDYYSHTVFEVTSGEKAQNSIGGGGRYDSLIKSFGGPDLSGIGFGTGIERVIQKLIEQNNIKIEPKTFLYFIPLGEKAKKIAFSYATKLRHLNIQTEINLNTKKLQKALKIANNLNTQYCIIIGDTEISSKKILIKDMGKRTQEEVALDELETFIQNLWEKHV